jgi:hypothetical protein
MAPDYLSHVRFNVTDLEVAITASLQGLGAQQSPMIL